MAAVIDEMLLQVHIVGAGYAAKLYLSSENSVKF